MSYVNSIVTNGIIGGLPGSNGFLLLSITELTPIPQSNLYSGGGNQVVNSPKKKTTDKKTIQIKFIYKGETHTIVKEVKSDKKVNINNVKFYIYKKQPKVKIIF